MYCDYIHSKALNKNKSVIPFFRQEKMTKKQTVRRLLNVQSYQMSKVKFITANVMYLIKGYQSGCTHLIKGYQPVGLQRVLKFKLYDICKILIQQKNMSLIQIITCLFQYQPGYHYPREICSILDMQKITHYY